LLLLVARKEDAKMGGKEQDANLGYGKQVANKVRNVAAKVAARY
jgi:hypothetical protein